MTIKRSLTFYHSVFLHGAFRSILNFTNKLQEVPGWSSYNLVLNVPLLFHSLYQNISELKFSSSECVMWQIRYRHSVIQSYNLNKLPCSVVRSLVIPEIFSLQWKVPKMQYKNQGASVLLMFPYWKSSDIFEPTQ